MISLQGTIDVNVLNSNRRDLNTLLLSYYWLESRVCLFFSIAETIEAIFPFMARRTVVVDGLESTW